MRRTFCLCLAALMCLGLLLAAVPESRANGSLVKKGGRDIDSADELNRYDIVTFGTYPNRSYTDYADIEWIVLNKNGSRVTMITRYVIDSMPYHNKDRKIIWQGSDLCAWLNDSFLYTAFTEEERALINGDVTIPSVSEAREIPSQYLATAFTPYAVSKGGNSGQNIWWLRDGNSTRENSDGEAINCASVVQQGSIYKAAYLVTFRGKGVRPMITIDLYGGSASFETPELNSSGDQESFVMKGNRAVTSIDDLKMYDEVTFGTYPYSSYGGSERIRWIVIGKSRNRVKLLSTMGLDCKKFQEPYSAAPWQVCSLNYWLNSDFRDTAFTMSEQALLGNEITLLSEAEARELPEYYRAARATEYAISRGADSSQGIWWLRDTEMRRVQSNEWPYDMINMYCASVVRGSGEIASAYFRVDLGHKMVRPVIEVDMSLLP